MRQVKIIRIIHNSECHDSGYSTEIIRDSITDWEEISEEDYELLSSRKHSKYFTDNSLILLEKNDNLFSIPRTIEGLKKELEKEDKEREKLKKEILDVLEILKNG